MIKYRRPSYIYGKDTALACSEYFDKKLQQNKNAYDLVGKDKSWAFCYNDPNKCYDVYGEPFDDLNEFFTNISGSDRETNVFIPISKLGEFGLGLQNHQGKEVPIIKTKKVFEVNSDKSPKVEIFNEEDENKLNEYIKKHESPDNNVYIREVFTHVHQMYVPLQERDLNALKSSMKEDQRILPDRQTISTNKAKEDKSSIYNNLQKKLLIKHPGLNNIKSMKGEIDYGVGLSGSFNLKNEIMLKLPVDSANTHALQNALKNQPAMQDAENEIAEKTGKMTTELLNLMISSTYNIGNTEDDKVAQASFSSLKNNFFKETSVSLKKDNMIKSEALYRSLREANTCLKYLKGELGADYEAKIESNINQIINYNQKRDNVHRLIPENAVIEVVRSKDEKGDIICTPTKVFNFSNKDRAEKFIELFDKEKCMNGCSQFLKNEDLPKHKLVKNDFIPVYNDGEKLLDVCLKHDQDIKNNVVTSPVYLKLAKKEQNQHSVICAVYFNENGDKNNYSLEEVKNIVNYFRNPKSNYSISAPLSKEVCYAYTHNNLVNISKTNSMTNLAGNEKLKKVLSLLDNPTNMNFFKKIKFKYAYDHEKNQIKLFESNQDFQAALSSNSHLGEMDKITALTKLKHHPKFIIEKTSYLTAEQSSTKLQQVRKKDQDIEITM